MGERHRRQERPKDLSIADASTPSRGGDALRRLIAATLAFSLPLSACLAGRSNTTWEEDAQDGVITPVPAVITPAFSAPADLVRPPPDLDPLDLEPEAASARLEHALLAFGAGQRARGTPLAPREAWPPEEIIAWRSLLLEVERALSLPGGSLPSRLLIQIRVILEAERERVVRANGPPPVDIDHRVARAFVHVARRLRDRDPDRALKRRSARFFLGWPVTPIILTSSFGYRRDPVHGDGRLGFHAGIDLAGRRGDEIYAAAPGEVIATGWNGGLGRAVFVQHESGFVTIYAHLSKALVRPGTLVDTGTCLGLMGSTGRATGAHLHFELRLGGTPLDPLEHLELGLEDDILAAGQTPPPRVQSPPPHSRLPGDAPRGEPGGTHHGTSPRTTTRSRPSGRERFPDRFRMPVETMAVGGSLTAPAGR